MTVNVPTPGDVFKKLPPTKNPRACEYTLPGHLASKPLKGDPRLVELLRELLTENQ